MPASLLVGESGLHEPFKEALDFIGRILPTDVVLGRLNGEGMELGILLVHGHDVDRHLPARMCPGGLR